MTDPNRPGPNFTSPSPGPDNENLQRPSEPVPDYNAPSAYSIYQGSPTQPPGGYAPQPGGYAPYPGYQPPGGGYYQAPAKKSPVLGIVSFCLVLIASFLVAYPFGTVDFVAAEAFVEASTSNPNIAMPDWAIGMMGFMVSGFILGLGGLVLSIVAIVVNRGRVWGVIGLIGCLVFPVVLFILFISVNPSVAYIS